MSAMLDTYDAPMSDYASDIDVFMQTHSDSWTQGDGTMDDDSFNTFNQSDPIKSAGMELVVSADPTHSSFDLPLQKEPLLDEDAPAVEVEMEEYVEEAREYEMVDDNDDPVHDIQDVEVADAHFPVADENSSPLISYPLPTETSASILEVTTLVSPLVTPDPVGDVAISPHDSPPTQDVAQNLEVPSITLDHSEARSIAIDTSFSADSHLVPLLGEENAETAAILDPQPVELEHETLSADSDGLDPVTEATDQEHPEGPSEHATESQAPVSPPELDRTQDVVTVVGQDSAEQQPRDNHDETAGSPSANPHEISEGVFIEPPPAILIELPWGERKYSIFNRPSPPSSRSTPSHDDFEPISDIIVLLHQQPTLFYEPVNSVFQALRQDAAFYSLADMREVELIFSIPSLNLAVSEDNIYASTVSLHDLSLLHDTSRAIGLLRIQLQIHAPRFTTRYDQLLEQMHRDVLDDDTDAPPAPPEQDFPNVDDNIVNNAADDEDTVAADSNFLKDDLSNHESPQPGSQDQPPSEHDLPSDTPEPRNEDGVTTTEPPSELVTEPEAVDLSKSEDDGVVFGEAEEEFAELSNHQAEEHAANVAPEEEYDDDGYHLSASLTDDQHPEADDENYLQEAEGDDGLYEEDDADSDATTEVPDADGITENDSVEGNTLDQPSDEVNPVDPNVDEVPEQSEDSEEQAKDARHNTDNDSTTEIVHHEHDGVEATSSVYNDEETEARQNQFDDAPNETQPKADDVYEQVDEAHNFANLPELPEDDEFWDDDLDGEGEVDVDGSYDDGEHDNGSPSNGSSVTLSSKSSKRGYSELDGGDDDDEFDSGSIYSPEKRTRLE